MADPEDSASDAGNDLAGVLRRNIEVMRERRRQEEAQASREEKLAQGITRFTGSMIFVYLHLVIVSAWIAVNLGWIPGLPRFDPSFVVLAMAASVEAIFLSTFVLISQNRISEAADRRAELDLQINLLAEHEVTRVVKLVAAIADKLGVEEGRDPDIHELKRDVAPEAVLTHLAEEDAREARG